MRGKTCILRMDSHQHEGQRCRLLYTPLRPLFTYVGGHGNIIKLSMAVHHPTDMVKMEGAESRKDAMDRQLLAVKKIGELNWRKGIPAAPSVWP